eukprot:jgi/Chrzof1/10840/Cz05g14040.t1
MDDNSETTTEYQLSRKRKAVQHALERNGQLIQALQAASKLRRDPFPTEAEAALAAEAYENLTNVSLAYTPKELLGGRKRPNMTMDIINILGVVPIKDNVPAPQPDLVAQLDEHALLALGQLPAGLLHTRISNALKSSNPKKSLLDGLLAPSQAKTATQQQTQQAYRAAYNQGSMRVPASPAGGWPVPVMLAGQQQQTSSGAVRLQGLTGLPSPTSTANPTVQATMQQLAAAAAAAGWWKYNKPMGPSAQQSAGANVGGVLSQPTNLAAANLASVPDKQAMPATPSLQPPQNPAPTMANQPATPVGTAAIAVEGSLGRQTATAAPYALLLKLYEQEFIYSQAIIIRQQYHLDKANSNPAYVAVSMQRDVEFMQLLAHKQQVQNQRLTQFQLLGAVEQQVFQELLSKEQLKWQAHSVAGFSQQQRHVGTQQQQQQQQQPSVAPAKQANQPRDNPSGKPVQEPPGLDQTVPAGGTRVTVTDKQLPQASMRMAEPIATDVPLPAVQGMPAAVSTAAPPVSAPNTLPTDIDTATSIHSPAAVLTALPAVQATSQVLPTKQGQSAAGDVAAVGSTAAAADTPLSGLLPQAITLGLKASAGIKQPTTQAPPSLVYDVTTGDSNDHAAENLAAKADTLTSTVSSTAPDAQTAHMPATGLPTPFTAANLPPVVLVNGSMPTLQSAAYMPLPAVLASESPPSTTARPSAAVTAAAARHATCPPADSSASVLAGAGQEVNNDNDNPLTALGVMYPPYGDSQ